MIYRIVSQILRSSRKSLLLLGPRQVGKSTLVTSLQPDIEINLADQAEYFRFTSNPNELRERIETARPKTVFIDEVQRYPALLNTVQALSDSNKNLKFYLTGSSARKLKRGQANLLPGRVVNYYLGPLTAAELDYKLNDTQVMRFGALPEVYLDKDPKLKIKILSSYLVNYIQEEVRAEALVRNIDSFARSIPHVFQTAGQFVDYSKLAKQAKVSRHALARFYEIFEDTLIGYRAWPDAVLLDKADLIKHPKFFVFDIGVYNAAVGGYDLSDDRKGILFEQLLYTQLLHSAWAKDLDISINTFRTRGGLEVDFIVTLDKQRIAIEAKAMKDVYSDGVQSILRIRREYEPKIQGYVAHLGKESKKIDGVWCHPWQKLLKELGL